MMTGRFRSKKERAVDKNATLFDVEEEHSLENGKTERAPRNRTLELSEEDRLRLRPLLIKEAPKGGFTTPPVGTIQGDCTFQNLLKVLYNVYAVNVNSFTPDSTNAVLLSCFERL